MQNQHLDLVAIAGAKHFNEKYEGDERDKELEGLGIEIAQWTEWSGRDIMMIFQSALEDANFHKEAAIVQSWLDNPDD